MADPILSRLVRRAIAPAQLSLERRDARLSIERIDARLARIEKHQADHRKLLRDLRRSVAALDKALDPRATAGRTMRIEQNLEALIRLTALDGLELPYPQRLTTRRFRLRSQNAEDGLTLALLKEAGQGTRRFVELGCGDNGGNSGFLAEELGWTGLMVDGSAERLARLRGTVSPERVAVVEAWMTAESVDTLAAENGLVGDIDVLSIDIDGNDYWLWSSPSVLSPRIVVIEYNSMFGAERTVVVPYDPEFRRRLFGGLKGTYYGASLRALTKLGQSRGYRLVAVEARGANAYYLRNDVAPHVPEVDPGAEFRMLDKYAALVASGFDFWALVAENSLPLLDLEAANEQLSAETDG